jgi:hypothetical protein
MSRFVENATRILEAAENAMRSGATPTPMTILVRPEGTLEVLSDSDSPLDTLQMVRGAAMVYRINQQNGRVRVEGRAGSNTCIFETEKPVHAAQRALSAHQELRPLLPSLAKLEAAPPARAALPPARTWPPPPEEWD